MKEKETAINPELLRRYNEIFHASLKMDHPWLSTLSPETLEQLIQAGEEVLGRIDGVPMIVSWDFEGKAS